MNLFLAHIDWTPAVYGLVIFIGIFSMLYKIKKGYFVAFAAEASIFWLVFKLHGGTMAGGFAATVAALIAGLTVPLLFRSRS